MKGFTSILPFVALASAFVIPDERVMSQIAAEVARAPEVVDDAFFPKGFMSNIEEVMTDVEVALEDLAVNLQEGLKSHHHFRGCDKSVERSDKPHHPHKPEKSLYELINDNKYTTKFAELVEEFDDIKELLKSTEANITIFVPSDKAFKKIPKHGGKPPKDLIKKVLKYHIVPDVYPAGRVFASHTIPTLLDGTSLSDTPENSPQRLSVKFGLAGLTLNGYSRVRYPNRFATNGVIHGIDSLLFPPPPIAAIVNFLPQAFSTLELALVKTGLDKLENSTHLGATLFAPPNHAWNSLGVKANAFLFSKYGVKYLKALVQYHIVVNQTLYSDAYYGPKSADDKAIPKSVYHVDLPTLLKGRHLEIDIARHGVFIEIKINAFSRVAYQDAVAKDGVIQIPNRVLIPPKQYNGESMHYEGGEITVEELKERLDPYISNTDDVESGSNVEL